MAIIARLAEDASLPRDAEGPVFSAPWEAQAFALVVLLFEQGHYTWPEWVRYLSAEIAAAKASPHHPQAYYEQWLVAAEKLVAAKGVASLDELAARRRDLLALYDHDRH